MPAHTTRTEAGDALFFKALENGHSVRMACAASGYTRQVVYRWRQRDRCFDENWHQAVMMGADLLEDEADRRGRDGYDEPVFSRGGLTGTKRKYSDGLLLARLKAVRPELYRERVTTHTPQPAPVVMVRDFDLEDQVRLLIQDGRLSPSELPPHVRARVLRGKDG
jgi:hypothetical protein